MPKARGKPRDHLSQSQLLGLYQSMLVMKHFEVALMAQSQAGELRGSLHLATGQEALPSGACLALRPTDGITMTYRGHGYVLAKGCDMNRVMAEICGKSTGICGGKGGKMHLFDVDNGVLGSNGIVAGGMPTALGAAFSAKTLGDDRVSMTVFGDGAMNQGVAHEVLNMAGLWKLPIVFLCENNLYAEMTPLGRSSAVTRVADRAASYGIQSETIDGNDVLAVYDSVASAVSRARNGQGPTFIEAMTYRTCGHYHLDPGFGYRTKEEVEDWEKNSPVLRYSLWLKSSNLATDEDLMRLDDDAKASVEAAVQFMLNSPLPNESTALEGVFV